MKRKFKHSTNVVSDDHCNHPNMAVVTIHLRVKYSLMEPRKPYFLSKWVVIWTVSLIQGGRISVGIIRKKYRIWYMLCHRGLLLLTRKLLNQGFLLVKLKLLLGKFYSRHHVWVDRYGISGSQMITDVFRLRWSQNLVISSFMTFHKVCNKSSTMGAASWAGTVYLSGAPEFTHGF